MEDNEVYYEEVPIEVYNKFIKPQISYIETFNSTTKDILYEKDMSDDEKIKILYEFLYKRYLEPLQYIRIYAAPLTSYGHNSTMTKSFAKFLRHISKDINEDNYDTLHMYASKSKNVELNTTIYKINKYLESILGILTYWLESFPYSF